MFVHRRNWAINLGGPKKLCSLWFKLCLTTGIFMNYHTPKRPNFATFCLHFAPYFSNFAPYWGGRVPHGPFCQALSLSLCLSISLSHDFSLSLRDRDRADTIITCHHHHRQLFKDLRVDLYSSVIHHWNRLLKPILFLHWKHRVNLGHYSPPLSAIGLRYLFSWRLSQTVSQP